MKKIINILIILFILYPLYIISFLFKRNYNKWIFGSENKFDGNCKYFFIQTINKYPNINCIWITKNKEEINLLIKNGYNVHYLYSLKALYHLLTSGVYITSHPLNDSLPIWTIGVAKHINLWHGIGIKNMYFKANTKYHYLRYHHPIVKYLYYPFIINILKKPDLFLSTSRKMNKHFKDSFKLKNRNILEGYYPRCNLLTMEKNSLETFIKINESSDIIDLIEKIKNYDEVFIYMPTWREDNKNFLDDFLLHLRNLNKHLKQKNKLLLLKLHPRTPLINRNSINNYSNLILLNNKIDIYPILPFTDTLITDYSSIYYDYILMKEKRTIFFIPDYNSYIKCRDLAFDYFSSIKGDIVYDFNGLLNKIISDDHHYYNNDDIIKDFWGISDDKRDIHKAIINILKNKYNEK